MKKLSNYDGIDRTWRYEIPSKELSNSDLRDLPFSIDINTMSCSILHHNKAAPPVFSGGGDSHASSLTRHLSMLELNFYNFLIEMKNDAICPARSPILCCVL